MIGCFTEDGLVLTTAQCSAFKRMGYLIMYMDTRKTLKRVAFFLNSKQSYHHLLQVSFCLLDDLQRPAVQCGYLRGLHVCLHGGRHDPGMCCLPLVSRRHAAICCFLWRSGACRGVRLVLLVDSCHRLVRLLC